MSPHDTIRALHKTLAETRASLTKAEDYIRQLEEANQELTADLDLAEEAGRAARKVAEARLAAELGQPWDGMPEGWSMCSEQWRKGYGIPNQRASVRQVTYADGTKTWAWACYRAEHLSSYAKGDEALAYDAIMAAEAALAAGEVSDG
jgi:hypothetical protein